MYVDLKVHIERMDPNTQLYREAAIYLGFEIEELPVIRGFRVHMGPNNYYFSVTSTPFNNMTSMLVANNKYATNQLLADAGYPVPKSTFMDKPNFSHETVIEVAKEIGFPIVAKPLEWSGLGKDVICNLSNHADLMDACERLFEDHFTILFEKFHGGLQSYRVLVFQGQVLGVVERHPAKVTGDGHTTLKKLVEQENNRRASISDFLGLIEFEEEASFALKDQNLTLKSVPKNGQSVYLGYTCNCSRGGTIRTLPPSAIGKENRKLLVGAAKLINLDLVGIDIECKDIKEPMQYGDGVIIEMNFNPSIRIHEDGVGGMHQKVSRAIVGSLARRHPFHFYWHVVKTHKVVGVVSAFILATVVLFAASSTLREGVRSLWKGLIGS